MAFDPLQRTATPIARDPLGKLLNSLHMESAFYTASTLRRPWAMSMPPMANCMMFHLVTQGEVQFHIDNLTLALQTGDFILFPQGAGHELSDGQCQHVVPLSELPIKAVTERYETLTFGGEGEATQLICGVLLFQHPLALKLLGILPSHIVIDQAQQDTSAMVTTVSDLLKAEAQHIATGAEAVIARLADILVIATMRQHLKRLPDEQMGWLGALEDDRIGKAMQLVQAHPDKHWTLEDLAGEVGMSRTAFAQQFKQLVGSTPMDYLSEWRMSLAFSKLQMSKDTVLSIALDIGYQSEASFSRAFKKVVGKSPGEVRRAFLHP